MTETPGHRLYLIRLACGDGLRRAEPLAEFVQRVEKRTGVKYHATTVSMLERNQQQWRLSDIRTFAAVDPLNRGASWLSALQEGQSDAIVVPDPRKDQGLTEQQVARAERQAETDRRARQQKAAGAEPAKRRRPKR